MRAIVDRDDEIEAAVPHAVADRCEALVEGQAHCGPVVWVRDSEMATRPLPRLVLGRALAFMGTSFPQVDNASISFASMRAFPRRRCAQPRAEKPRGPIVPQLSAWSIASISKLAGNGL